MFHQFVTILDTFHSILSHLTHYLTCADPMTHTDSYSVTHRLQIVPYDIITDVTMTHADSCLLTTYVIMTHTDKDRIICLFNTNILY